MSIETSEKLDKYAPAFLAFQREVKDPKKESVNPHFKSKFASLESTIEAVRPIANKHGLTISQWRTGKGVTTMILHESGQYVRGEAEMVLEKATPQGLGSATTYERRYSLLGATGTSGDVDDDGEHAEEQHRAPAQAPKPPPVDEAKTVKRFVDSIAGATTMGGLSIIGKAIAEAGLSEAAKAQVRGIYAGKAHELEVGDE